MNICRLRPLEKPAETVVSIPGSKSYTNRAFLMAAMARHPVKIVNALESDDTLAMSRCLMELDKKRKLYQLDANLSGTTIRFILTLACTMPGVKVITGAPGLNKRPIGELVRGLRQLGAKIKYLNKVGFPPVEVTSERLEEGVVEMDGGVSSQYFSAILMVAPRVGEVIVKVRGEQISKSYIDMTIDMMRQFGVKVVNENYKKYVVPGGQQYSADSYVVEGDVSSAGYFAAIATLTGAEIRLKNVNPMSVQGDMEFIRILKGMGNVVKYGDDEIIVRGRRIEPVDVDMENCPDQVQTLAVLAAFADGVTRISGVRSLRVKETERVVAVQNELRKMGIRTKSTHNTLTIYGGNPKAARIDTYGDHRMAMAFAVAGAKIGGMEIVNPQVVSKTWPNFWKELKRVGVGVKKHSLGNVVLVGLRGSGKTTVGKLLAKSLGKTYVDTDEEVVKKTKMSIPKLVDKYSWDYFRNREAEVVNEVSWQKDCVVATGGGVVLRSENVAALKRNGVCIYLTASINILEQRTRGDANRPNLSADMETIAKQRVNLYEDAADMIIDTDELEPKLVAGKIYDYIS